MYILSLKRLPSNKEKYGKPLGLFSSFPLSLNMVKYEPEEKKEGRSRGESSKRHEQEKEI